MARTGKSRKELEAIRDSVALVGRLSDSLFRVGPFSIGIDGVLSWIPGIGELYSGFAGGFIILQGVRAGVPAHILIAAAFMLGSRTLMSAVPIAGSAAADLFTAHKWAAASVVKAIDQQLGFQGRDADNGRWGPTVASAP